MSPTQSPTQDRPAAPVRPWSPPLPRTGGSTGSGVGTGPGQRVDVVLAAITDTCRRYGPVALRLSLALVFVWFGALKLTGNSPVEGLCTR